MSNERPAIDPPDAAPRPPAGAGGGAEPGRAPRAIPPAEALMTRVHEHELVRQGMRILRSEAARLGRQLGGAVAPSELEALGHLALVAIVRAFDPARGAFAPFAARRLRWALLDALRQESHGRVAYARARAVGSLDHSNDGQHGLERPTTQRHAAESTDELRGLLRRHAGTIAVALVAASGDLADAVDPVASPEQLVARRQAAARLWSAVRQLPAQQRELVERHYQHGEPFGRIAADLGLSRGWASRLHAQAVTTLAAALPTG